MSIPFVCCLHCVKSLLTRVLRQHSSLPVAHKLMLMARRCPCPFIVWLAKRALKCVPCGRVATFSRDERIFNAIVFFLSCLQKTTPFCSLEPSYNRMCCIRCVEERAYRVPATLFSFVILPGAFLSLFRSLFLYLCLVSLRQPSPCLTTFKTRISITLMPASTIMHHGLYIAPPTIRTASSG